MSFTQALAGANRRSSRRRSRLGEASGAAWVGAQADGACSSAVAVHVSRVGRLAQLFSLGLLWLTDYFATMVLASIAGDYICFAIAASPDSDCRWRCLGF